MPFRPVAQIAAAFGLAYLLQMSLSVAQTSSDEALETFRIVCMDGIISPDEIPKLAQKRGLRTIEENEKAYSITHLWAGRAAGRDYLISFSRAAPRCDLQVEGLSLQEVRLWLMRVANVPPEDVVRAAFEAKYGDHRLHFFVGIPTGNRTMVSVRPSESSRWGFKEETSRVDGTKRAWIWKKSAEELQYAGGLKYWPYILVQCSVGKTSVWLDFERFLGVEGQNVAFKINDKPAQRTWMTTGSSNKALGLLGGNAINFLKQLLAAADLHVRVTPFGSGPIEVSFDLRGMDAAIRPVRASCNW